VRSRERTSDGISRLAVQGRHLVHIVARAAATLGMARSIAAMAHFYLDDKRVPSTLRPRSSMSVLRPSLPFGSMFQLPESCRSRATSKTGDLIRGAEPPEVLRL
jgi:hypothetical protein